MRSFYLHIQSDSPLLEEITSVVKPVSIFTKDWDLPIRVIPTIQFHPEVNELIEGETAIRAYIESLKPRPLARERQATLPQIKTKVAPKEAEKKMTEKVSQPEAKPSKIENPPVQKKVSAIRSVLTEEIEKAAKKKPQPKKRVRISSKPDIQ